MEKTNIINKKSKKRYFSSLVFLFLVLISTITLKFYNSNILSEVNDINTSISKIESNIKEIESDKNIQVYSLLEANKKVIDMYEKMNYIVKYLNHMSILEGIYELEFKGFDLSNGEVKTSVKTSSDDNGIAYQKARDFINKYRNDEKSLFDLGFVSNIIGMDEMKFNVSFKIK